MKKRIFVTDEDIFDMIRPVATLVSAIEHQEYVEGGSIIEVEDDSLEYSIYMKKYPKRRRLDYLSRI